MTAPYGPAWGRGEQLALQGAGTAVNREDWKAPYALTYTADEPAAEDARGVVRPGVKHLTVGGITRLDCTRLVAAFPPTLIDHVLDDQRRFPRTCHLHKLVDIHHTDINDTSRLSFTTGSETEPFALRPFGQP